MSKTEHGTFVWYDINTEDPDAAKAFYTEAFGLKSEPFEAAPDYTVLKPADRGPWGGINKLSDDAKKMGAPPHWLGHILVDDVDATAAKCKELGGSVYMAPMDMGEVGRMAILADPQGATFSAYKGFGGSDDDSGSEFNEPAQVGSIAWRELHCTDWEAAWKFYNTLFGWEQDSREDMGPDMGTYLMWKWKGAHGRIGGMDNAAKMMDMPAHWLFYIRVDDIDAAAQRVKDKGGKVLNGPMDVPGGDKVAQCQDPTGAHFAIHWTAG